MRLLDHDLLNCSPAWSYFWDGSCRIIPNHIRCGNRKVTNKAYHGSTEMPLKWTLTWPQCFVRHWHFSFRTSGLLGKTRTQHKTRYLCMVCRNMQRNDLWYFCAKNSGSKSESSVETRCLWLSQCCAPISATCLRYRGRYTSSRVLTKNGIHVQGSSKVLRCIIFTALLIIIYHQWRWSTF